MFHRYISAPLFFFFFERKVYKARAGPEAPRDKRTTKQHKAAPKKQNPTQDRTGQDGKKRQRKEEAKNNTRPKALALTHNLKDREKQP